MDYPLDLEGFDKQKIVLETGGFFSRSQILIDGRPAPRGAKPGLFVLTRDTGSEVLVQLRGVLLDAVPVVIVDGRTMRVAEPFTIGQQLLAGLSFVVAIIMSAAGLMLMRHLPKTGAIQLMGILSMTINLLLGGLLGFLSMIINRRILRSEMSRSSQMFSIGAITIIVVIGFLVVFILLAAILNVLAGLVHMPVPQ